MMGAPSILWFIAVTQFSDDILNDSLHSLDPMIVFYYGMTAFACVVYYRRLELKRFRTFVSVGLIPAAGGLAMVAILIGACFGMAQESHRVFGVGRPLVLSAAALMVGVAVMICLQRFRPAFFKRRAARVTVRHVSENGGSTPDA